MIIYIIVFNKTVCWYYLFIAILKWNEMKYIFLSQVNKNLQQLQVTPES